MKPSRFLYTTNYSQVGDGNSISVWSIPSVFRFWFLVFVFSEKERCVYDFFSVDNSLTTLQTQNNPPSQPNNNPSKKSLFLSCSRVFLRMWVIIVFVSPPQQLSPSFSGLYFSALSLRSRTRFFSLLAVVGRLTRTEGFLVRRVSMRFEFSVFCFLFCSIIIIIILVGCVVVSTLLL